MATMKDIIEGIGAGTSGGKGPIEYVQSGDYDRYVSELFNAIKKLKG